MEDSFISLKEFTFEHLHAFSNRLKEIERKQTNNDKEVREDLERLSGKCSDMESRQNSDVSELPLPSAPIQSQVDPLPSAPIQSQVEKATRTTVVQSAPRNPFAVPIQQPPEELDDVANYDLREALKTYIAKTSDSREKLNKVQLAFVNRWMAIHNDVKGNRLLSLISVQQ